MATLYGGAMPDDFVSGEELTATEFNKVKNYWIVDGDLPEGPEILDGDVVFVLGDETIGTADITAITGSGITHTYGDFVAFEFRTDGTLTSTEGVAPEFLLIAGGGAGGNDYGGGGAGSGGYINGFNLFMPTGTSDIIVGDGGAPTATSTTGGSGEFSAINMPSGKSVAVVGGGGGGSGGSNGFPGGSGGAASGAQTGGAGFNLGFAGASSSGSTGGSGGGSASAGTSGSSAAGGLGSESSITGYATFRSSGGAGYAGNRSPGGGGGGGGLDGDAGTGGGGGSINNGSAFNSGAGGSGTFIIKVLAANAANVDKSGWTEVTALMLAEAKKKRELERKAEQLTRVLEEKKLALEQKNEELSGATQMDIEGDLI